MLNFIVSKYLSSKAVKNITFANAYRWDLGIAQKAPRRSKNEIKDIPSVTWII